MGRCSEVGDLPLPMQVKLLRVLQEREVVRVGSYTPIPIDVRLIAATTVKLEEAVLAGHFREDLYYRLKVASLDLAPLRDRPDDIMPLAEHFARFYGQRLGSAPHVFADDARRALLEHPWPGNIRELENVIHHALLVTRNCTIGPPDLHLSPFSGRVAPSRQGSESDSPDRTLTSVLESGDPQLYAKIEWAVWANAFNYARGNQLAMARLLGLSRHVVRARLIEYGILVTQRAVAPSRSNETRCRTDTLTSSQRAHRTAADQQFDEKDVADAATDWWGF